jgi:hypothetical protein
MRAHRAPLDLRRDIEFVHAIDDFGPASCRQRMPFGKLRAMDRSPRLTLLMISTPFWLYVMLSDVLYAYSMQVNVAQVTSATVFAPWGERVLQHLLLFPVLLVCFSWSLRLGWRTVRRVAVQLLLAAGFAALSYWAMELADQVFRRLQLLPHAPPPGQDATSIGPLWTASFIKFALTYGFGLALVSGFALYRRMRDAQLRVAALERESSAARLAALRMQLSPHTLFNLLHTIRGQIDWQPRLARSMVVQLAELLRRLLNAGQRDFSPLHDELRFARLYLELQQQRFADRIDAALPDPDTQPNVWVPSLILQPLIENAVVHGLAGHDQPASIRMEVVLVADTLTLRVVNSTRGDSPQRDGIGLRNVRERLAVQFAARASLRAEPVDATTWVSEVTMPALREISPQSSHERVA